MKRALYAVYVLAVALLASELALRAFDPLGATYFFEMDRYFRGLRADERFAYIHPPGLRETFQGVELRTNREGLRGPELDERKAPGVQPADAEGVLGRYEERLAELGVPCFALPDELFAGGLAYRNSAVDAHLNPRGHALVAERMRRDLAPWLATPPPDAAAGLPPTSSR